MLRHPSSASDRSKSALAQAEVESQTRALTEAGVVLPPPVPPGFLFLDPPDHTRMRKLVSKAFAPRVVNALNPTSARWCDGLLDQIAARGHFDVIADLAYPLPVAVICRLLGVPIEDEPQFSRASAPAGAVSSTRSSPSPVSRRMGSTSGCGPDCGCADTCTT